MLNLLHCIWMFRFSAFGCPYSHLNKDKEWALCDRLLSARSESDVGSGVSNGRGIKHSYNSNGGFSTEMKFVPSVV